MVTEKRLKGYDPITLESFTRHMTKHREPYDQYDMGYVDAVEQIENFLEYNTVDSVEVIRCKDCISGKGSTHKVCQLYKQGLMKDNDFCSYGERKDNV